MTNTEALEILQKYQAWSNGDFVYGLHTGDMRKAIDIAIDALKRFGEHQPYCKCSECCNP